MPDGRTPRLDEQLCFALYAATNAITRSYRSQLGEIGLTYPQYLVMLTLLDAESMTSGELARALKLDAGTLTPMLKRLALAGLITRERRANDERVIDNRLSEAGLALRHSMRLAQRDVQCRTGLDDQALAALRDTLHQLTATLARASEELEPA